ncbi:carcinine hydrolase/isopenicillin-N N-acyltransferase family protein [Bacteroidota bacterium]
MRRLINQMRHHTYFFTAILILIFNSCTENGVDDGNGHQTEPTVENLSFNEIISPTPDSIKTLESLKKEGELFMMTYYGNYRSRLEELNNQIIANGIGSIIPPHNNNHECSIFSAMGNPQLPIFGRNLDNSGVQRGVMVGLYNPPNGYSSIAVTNMINMGFTRNDDPTQLSIEERLILLNAVLFATDGINENGVAIALASVDTEPLIRDESKKLVNLSYIMREVLDHAGNLDEAISIIQNHDVFDQNTSTISHHLLIADASGNSAVTEYREGEWKVMHNNRAWQIATNDLIYGKTEEWKRNQCERYRAADDYLNNTRGNVSWYEGINVLELMAEGTTQWSSIYDLVNRRVYISLYTQYNIIQSIQLH